MKVVDKLVTLSFNKCLYRMDCVPLMKIQSRLAGSTGLAGQLEAVLSYDTFDRLRTVGVPILVITGTGDRAILPSSSEELANGISGGRLVKIAGGSHALFIEMREDFNRKVLGFLGEALANRVASAS